MKIRRVGMRTYQSLDERIEVLDPSEDGSKDPGICALIMLNKIEGFEDLFSIASCPLSKKNEIKFY